MTDEKRNQVIMALISEPTKQKACEVLGITPRTLYNYMSDADFKKDYKEAVNNLLDDTIINYKMTMHNGAKILNDIIMSDTESTETKLKAIKIAVDSGIRLAEKTSDIKTSMFDDMLI